MVSVWTFGGSGRPTQPRAQPYEDPMTMTRRATAIGMMVVAACGGCQRSALRGALPGQDPAGSHPARSRTTDLGRIPQAGPLLPVTSPDGKWIAYLAHRGGEKPTWGALWTGNGLEGVSLHVRPVAPGGKGRVVCSSGAAWPAWSADSGRLAFIARNEVGRCDLGVYDMASGTARRVPVRLKRMVSPSPSPGGGRIAVVAGADGLIGPRLHVVDVATGRTTPCPAAGPKEQHLWPHWLDDERVVYVLAEGAQAWVVLWRPRKFPPKKVRKIHLPASRDKACGALAEVATPVGPGGEHFAYHDVAGRRIVLVNLRTGRQTKLRRGTARGCWLDGRRFVAATKEHALLYSPDTDYIRLAAGAGLPRGPAGADGVLLLAEVAGGRELRLVRADAPDRR